MRPKESPPLAASPGVSTLESVGGPPPEEALSVSPVLPGGEVPAAPAGGSSVQAGWRAVVSAEGTGAKRTALFPINSRFWRIIWATTPTQDANGWTYAIIYRSSGQNVGLALDGKGTRNGITRLQGRGTYYVEVKSTQNWTLNIEQWN